MQLTDECPPCPGCAPQCSVGGTHPAYMDRPPTFGTSLIARSNGVSGCENAARSGSATRPSGRSNSGEPDPIWEVGQASKKSTFVAHPT